MGNHRTISGYPAMELFWHFFLGTPQESDSSTELLATSTAPKLRYILLRLPTHLLPWCGKATDITFKWRYRYLEQVNHGKRWETGEKAGKWSWISRGSKQKTLGNICTNELELGRVLRIKLLNSWTGQLFYSYRWFGFKRMKPSGCWGPWRYVMSLPVQKTYIGFRCTV